jgi:hypothetical protein
MQEHLGMLFPQPWMAPSVCPPRADFLGQLQSATLSVFAPGLLEVLQSSTPPTTAFFKSLPTDYKKVWRIYLLILEKQDSRTKIYISSGTSTTSDVSAHLSQYDKKQNLPVNVKIALDEGYTIVHKGLLCSAPIPSAGEVPIARLLFVPLEAVITFVFWAAKSKTADMFGFADMCPWDRDTLEYDGLCSHNPLSESPLGDFTLSAEQLETMAAEYSEKRRGDKHKRKT